MTNLKDMSIDQLMEHIEQSRLSKYRSLITSRKWSIRSVSSLLNQKTSTIGKIIEKQPFQLYLSLGDEIRNNPCLSDMNDELRAELQIISDYFIALCEKHKKIFNNPQYCMMLKETFDSIKQCGYDVNISDDLKDTIFKGVLSYE